MCCSIGQPQRGNGKFPFAAETERRTAGHQHRQLRTGRNQPAYLFGRLQDLLEVIEDQQEMSVAQIGGDVLQDRPGAVGSHAKSLRYGGRDQRRVGQGG